MKSSGGETIGFKVLCTEFDHIFGKRGKIIQGRVLMKKI
jgi:hypothetical protein